MNTYIFPASYFPPAGNPYIAAQGMHVTPAAHKDVLIVEDEKALCDLLADVLEADGHMARKAANGLEALKRIEERRPQVVLLDMMMPVMDGWQFISHLRANPEWSTIPVVVMTAVYDMSSLERKTGAKAILTKPFDIELILEAVELYAE